MMKKATACLAVFVLIISIGAGCKRTYFRVTEESESNTSLRFATKKSYYKLNQSISLVGGRYAITSGDSLLLYLEGEAKTPGVGEVGVAELDLTETARLYITLPLGQKAGRQQIGQRSICEIIGSASYRMGENLFVCQSGEIVIDSLVGKEYYGKFTGKYLNTSNRSLTAEGDIRAGRK